MNDVLLSQPSPSEAGAEDRDSAETTGQGNGLAMPARPVAWRARVLRARVEQRFRRRERRYLLPSDQVPLAEREVRHLIASPSELISVLNGRAQVHEYDIRTIYLRSGGPTRYRLRYYDDSASGWIERKRRRGTLVAKRRRMLTVGESVRYTQLAQVTYRRKAWEIGGVRITVDEGVTCGDRVLGVAVAEVKGDHVPKWLKPLLPPAERAFSKRRWALGAWVAVA